MSQSRKPVAVAIGATLAGGLMLSGSAFASTPLAQGYLLGAGGGDKTAQGSCGADKKAGEGKCGSDKAHEGKCGAAAMDTDKDGKVSRAEFAAAHPDKAGDFDKMDADKNGYLDATEGKCGEGKCGGDKKAGDHHMQGGDMKDGKAAEGKCGEGKCGGSA